MREVGSRHTESEVLAACQMPQRQVSVLPPDTTMPCIHHRRNIGARYKILEKVDTHLGIGSHLLLGLRDVFRHAG